VELGAADAIVRCDALAERIDPAVHRFVVDVKAVTMHRFSVRREGGIWTATVVFDV
jgi:SHS2 domain-containing protein